MVWNWIKELDRVLRGEATRLDNLSDGTVRIPLLGLSFVSIVLGLLYGLCMGSYNIFRLGGPFFQQYWAGVVKVPALFFLTLLVTFPSLYVFNALVGSRLKLLSILRLLVAALGVTLAVLASLGPIVAFFSVSTTSYSFMVLFNVLVFALAGFLGLAFLLQTLHRITVALGDESRVREVPVVPEPVVPEIVQQADAFENDFSDEAVDGGFLPRPPMATPVIPGALDKLKNHVLSSHVKAVFRCWVVVFGLVGAQMAWVLRPFIGAPGTPFTWFRERDSNFFQSVLQTLQGLFQQRPMTALLQRADTLLRGNTYLSIDARPWRAFGQIVLMLLLFGMFYGCTMGSFGGVLGDRTWQVVYSALKVPLLLLATFCISLPSFFVLNTLFGLRNDFVSALGALLAGQAGLAVILSSLAPFTFLWYASSPDYQAAILFNGVMFAIASMSAQWMVRRYYQPLIERNEKHRLMLRAWLGVYMFVGIQMAWVLRPFVGQANLPVQFFRADAWDNAYVIVSKMIWDVLFRS